MTMLPGGSHEDRASSYAKRWGYAIARFGFGVDGTVFRSDFGSAIKVFERERSYRTERNVYLRLQEDQVIGVCGHAVPELIRFDDEAWIIEMTIVQPPYVLDFAKATIDVPPDFQDEVMEERQAYWADLFGDRWPRVVEIMRVFERRHGIYLLDPKPGNIEFSD
jgi:hypothetical protein